jgi:sugar phosphate isomerase/epimerase
MKYSFMSFSCPEASADDLIAMAKQYGYDGVEPRAASNHGHGIEIEAGGGEREKIKEKFSSSGVALSCLATSCKYADPAESDKNVDLTEKYIKLAADVGAPVLRVFGGILPEGMSREEAVGQVAECLSKVSRAAEEYEVAVCFETHDDWCEPLHVAEVMEKVNHPFIRVNWDIMHPVKRAGRTIDESFDILKPWISHVHFHDGIDLESGQSKLLPVGEGVVDHKRAVELLQGVSYSGFLSGEWIKWEPADVHLPREIKTMKGYEQG